MARIVTNHLRNRARDYAREKRTGKKEKRFDSESILDSGGAAPHKSVTAPWARAGREEEGNMIRFAMLLLSQADQDVLHFREWERLPFKEVAEHLDVAEDAARMRYKRAVQRLTRCVFLLKSGRIEDLPEDPPEDDPGEQS